MSKSSLLPADVYKSAGWVTNSEDHDQTPRSMASDLGPHYLPRPKSFKQLEHITICQQVCWVSDKQCIPWEDVQLYDLWIWVCTVCSGLDFRILRVNTVYRLFVVVVCCFLLLFLVLGCWMLFLFVLLFICLCCCFSLCFLCSLSYCLFFVVFVLFLLFLFVLCVCVGGGGVLLGFFCLFVVFLFVFFCFLLIFFSFY